MIARQDKNGGMVQLRSVCRRYELGHVPVTALVDVDLEIHANCFTVISGPSGSGKSTLLNLIGCLDVPDSGSIRIGGQDMAALSDDERSEFRAGSLGFVFQSFNLIPVLTALENVQYPLHLAGARVKRARAAELLAAVGLADKAHHRPSQLSGGQRQRVAIARALVNEPALVLADEPTANLDRGTGRDIIELMRRMQRDTGASFIFSSHDASLQAAADDCVHLVDGRVCGTGTTQGEPT
ncbi:MAG: ABC transporter ATP-binding protein [Sulfuritalea sp.]|nr:ABC transporter ATP-binding protein [Sulfuritalea sp.]MDP1983921.1 ABC transporter ATP-binding protein [Sulfuritalea sp.]